MAVLLKRQLTDDEKAIILGRCGRVCFANGHQIPEGEPIQFDHIKAYSTGGESELNNIAPMCGEHNRAKGALSLNDFRVKLRLEEFFKSGEKLTLGNLLQYFAKQKSISGYGQPVSVVTNDDKVVIRSASRSYETNCYRCPVTGWTYAYLNLDVDLIDSDDDQDHQMGLQPRYLIFDKVFQMFRHFQLHPVLQPSIGRIVDNRVRLFDGQHKVAALLWNDERRFECKVYLDAELRLLNQTNIAAHDTFAQTRFYSSIMVLKLGSQFGKDFEDYKNLEGEPVKSEAGFMKFLSQLDGGSPTRGDLNERFRSYLYSSVLEHPDNKLKPLISASNRSTRQHPITMDMLQKSLFSGFLYRTPTNDNMATEAYKRDAEIGNMVAVLNMLYDQAFCSWNPEASENNEHQRHLDRLLRSKSMMAWSELVRDAVCGKLDLQDAEERERPLYRTLSDDELKRIRGAIERLANWSRWKASSNDEIDRILSDKKSAVKEWFKKCGLTTGYLMGAPE